MTDSSLPLIAEIGVSGTSVGYDKRYSYIVPDEYADVIRCGERVIVPFGRGSRKRIGIVLSLSSGSGINTEKYKDISAVIDKAPVIGDEMQQMLIWIRENTLCTYYEAFKVLIPAGLNVSCKLKYSIAEITAEQKKELSPHAADLYSSFTEVKKPA